MWFYHFHEYPRAMGEVDAEAKKDEVTRKARASSWPAYGLIADWPPGLFAWVQGNVLEGGSGGEVYIGAKGMCEDRAYTCIRARGARAAIR